MVESKRTNALFRNKALSTRSLSGNIEVKRLSYLWKKINDEQYPQAESNIIGDGTTTNSTLIFEADDATVELNESTRSRNLDNSNGGGSNSFDEVLKEKNDEIQKLQMYVNDLESEMVTFETLMGQCGQVLQVNQNLESKISRLEDELVEVKLALAGSKSREDDLNLQLRKQVLTGRNELEKFTTLKAQDENESSNKKEEGMNQSEGSKKDRKWFSSRTVNTI